MHRTARARKADAVLQRVRDQVGRWVFPVHRLDFQTSGCLILATRRAAAGPLHASLTAATSRKTYLALVRGWFPHDDPVVVDNPMKNDKGVLKQARSVVEFLGRSHEPRCSLLRVRPRTGRYHQVRRHVRDLHHPVVGDSQHGDTRINRWWREEMGLTRLGLHALSLDLTLPDGDPLQVICPLFPDHHALLTRLPWWEDACAAEPSLRLPPLRWDTAEPPPDLPSSPTEEA